MVSPVLLGYQQRAMRHGAMMHILLPIELSMSAQLSYAIVPVTPFDQNASVLWCPVTRQAVVCDPGGNLERIEALVKKESLTLVRILVTHGHIDHAGGVAELAARLNLPIEGPHRDDQFWIDGMPQQSKMFGFPPVASFTPDRWLAAGDQVSFGEVTLDVLHCPGHTPGHVCFYHADSQLLLVGDVLFQGSIGRTDFPRGDHATLIRSIRKQLFPLGDDVAFIPGHGPMSTLGAERRNNPYVQD